MKFKLHLVSLLSMTSVILMNSILVVLYINLFLYDSIHDIIALDIKVYDVFITVACVMVFLLNLRIPFIMYEDEEECGVSIDVQFINELSDITGHLFSSCFATSSLIIIMYLFTL